MKPVYQGEDANPFPVNGKTSIKVTANALRLEVDW